MIALLLTGALAGLAVGYVLQRGDLCFHSLFADLWARRTFLVRGWLLGVGLGSVGLSVLYLLPLGDGLNRGLAFRPVGNVLGGLMIGVGMAVARSCASGLFYKLGAGMLGALVGLAGWAAGEYAASRVDLPGPTVLGGGTQATFAGLLGLPRLLVAVLFLVLVLVVVTWRRDRVAGPRTAHPGWSWPRIGVALGIATTLAWLLAAVGGASYGPSTVGAVAGSVAGRPPWWLIGFLLALVAGGQIAARVGDSLWVRGETRVRYGQLLLGGALLGAGGWWAGGCNLGHGLSGIAQLNVSSWVAVVSMALGVWLGHRVQRSRRTRPDAPDGSSGDSSEPTATPAGAR